MVGTVIDPDPIKRPDIGNEAYTLRGATKIIARQGKESNSPRLLPGELGWDTDTYTIRYGDGSASPAKAMTTKSTGNFDYSRTGLVTFTDLEIKGTINGWDPDDLVSSVGLVTHRGGGRFGHVKFVSSDGTIEFTNEDGDNGNEVDVKLGKLPGGVPVSAQLDAAPGIVVRTTLNNFTHRKLATTSNLTIYNQDGVDGDPTLDLSPSALAALAVASGLSIVFDTLRSEGAPGLMVYQGASPGTYGPINVRELEVGVGLNLSNPDGIDGNPRIEFTPATTSSLAAANSSSAVINAISSPSPGILSWDGSSMQKRNFTSPDASISIGNSNGAIGNPTIEVSSINGGTLP